MKTFVVAWALGALSSVSLIALTLTTVVRSLDAKTFIWDGTQWLWGGLTLVAVICSIVLVAFSMSKEF